jgi:hypothetical protein
MNMTPEVERELKHYHNVRMMLESLPGQLRRIFVPATVDEMARLETNILSYKSREREREQVIAIQRLCGFPLRPNLPLREVKAMARIEGRRKDKLRNQRNDDEDVVY